MLHTYSLIVEFNVRSSTYRTNLKTLCTAQKWSTGKQPHSRDIFINQNILPVDKLINKEEGILAYKVINGTYLLKDFLNHGDVGHQTQLRNGGDLRLYIYHYMQKLNLNSLFAIEPSKRGMANQVTSAAHHHSVLSRINYDSCICLFHSFPIYVVSMMIKLLSGTRGNLLCIVEWLSYYCVTIFFSKWP